MGFAQIMKVGQKMHFVGPAKHKRNVEGPMLEKMVHFHDHFTDDTLSTDKWLVTVTNGTVAVDHTYPGGWALFTTAASQDGEASFLAGPLWCEDDMYSIMEARILITDVSGVYVGMFLTDATLESTPNTPIDYDGGTLAAAATNAVGIIQDADDSVNGVNSIVAVGVNGGSLETAIDSATDWADGKIHTLRIELNADGDASFYLDEVLFGFMETAVTSGTALCPMIVVANRDAGADTVYVDRVDVWQNEYTV